MHGREKGACIPASPFHRMLSTDASAFISAPQRGRAAKSAGPLAKGIGASFQPLRTEMPFSAR